MKKSSQERNCAGITMLTENLAERMDAEFAAAELKVKQLQKQQVEQYEQRQRRAGAQILPARLQERATKAVPRADRRRRQELEVFPVGLRRTEVLGRSLDLEFPKVDQAKRDELQAIREEIAEN